MSGGYEKLRCCYSLSGDMRSCGVAIGCQEDMRSCGVAIHCQEDMRSCGVAIDCQEDMRSYSLIFVCLLVCCNSTFNIMSNSFHPNYT